MRNLKTILILSAIFTIALFAGEKSTFKVDTKATKVKWTGEKFGGEHYGYIKVKEGMINVDDSKISGGNFTIDMNTMTVDDLEPGEWHDKLLGHLKSDDFFSVAKHNSSKFEIFSVKDKGNGTIKVSGNLTIKGIKKLISFDAKYKISGNKLTAEARIPVDRTKFDIKYGSGSFFDVAKDKMIYDDFFIDLNLVATK